MAYLIPTSLSDAFGHLGRGGASVIAGGTDWFPARGAHLPKGDLVDITALPGFCGIALGSDGWRIGAATTWSEVMRADLPPAFDALKLAAAEIGSVQIQNAGTVAGNLCNASPAADGVPPLLVLDASVELVSSAGTRVLPLSEFLRGPRKTALAPGELVAAVLIPEASGRGHSGFLKAGSRKYLVISVAMLAARLEVVGGTIVQAALAVGSCGPTATRLSRAEARLVGAALGDLPKIEAGDFPEIRPIDDHRASAAYRRAATQEMLDRVLRDLVRQG